MRTKKAIYLDHAATTPVDPQVRQIMLPFFSKHYANPSALYKEALIVSGAINDARRKVADVLHTNPDSILFTSGGTESNNLAILGIAHKHINQGKHIIVSAIEHHSVLYPLESLEKDGWSVTKLPVDENGLVNVADVIKAIRAETVLISVMYANNEIGTIEPIAEIGRQLLRYRKEKNTVYPYFHTDAAQAAGYLDLDVEKLHVDLMTVKGGKIYGPKGSGVLFVRRGVAIEPIMTGGTQEKGIRAGTENIPGIVGLGQALKLVQKKQTVENSRLRALSEFFFEKLRKILPDIRLNGLAIGDNRLPNNLNVVFDGVDGEALVIYLDSRGIMCATGSACTAISREPSHVLAAIGKNSAEILCSVRFTLGRETTKARVITTIKAIAASLKMLKSDLK